MCSFDLSQAGKWLNLKVEPDRTDGHLAPARTAVDFFLPSAVNYDDIATSILILIDMPAALNTASNSILKKYCHDLVCFVA